MALPVFRTTLEKVQGGSLVEGVIDWKCPWDGSLRTGLELLSGITSPELGIRGSLLLGKEGVEDSTGESGDAGPDDLNLQSSRSRNLKNLMVRRSPV